VIGILLHCEVFGVSLPRALAALLAGVDTGLCALLVRSLIVRERGTRGGRGGEPGPSRAPRLTFGAGNIQVVAKFKAWRGQAKGAPPDPSRNAHVERGRVVMVSEVQPYALPMHQKCRQGIVRRTDPPVACACATKRFLKAHPEVIVDKDGRAWWPAKVIA
jgi:hypothetical protein